MAITTAVQPARAGAQRAILLELPAFDYPDNLARGYAFPSMQQSLFLTKDFYQLASHLIGKAWGDNARRATLSQAAFEVLATYLPLGDAWLHEEWHRAVLRNRGIESANDVYRLQLFAPFIRVSHVRDEDLVSLKRDHPAEQVRLAAAGLEAEYQHVTAVTKDRVFLDANPYGDVTRLLSVANAIAYVGLSSFDYVNRETDRQNREEGADVQARDALGWDFTAWVYDLHRPNEPYDARGIHPSGVGIDRYIKPDDLTAAERRFLRLQGWLSLLNLVDPSLYGLRAFTGTSPLNGRPLRYNLGLRHLLTSFGYTVDANVLLKQGTTNLFIVVHNYVNGARYFPGAEVEVVRYRVSLGGATLVVSPRLAAWLQPAGQRFRSSAATGGALAAVKVGPARAGRLGWYVEVGGKTAGWVAGNVHLGPNVGFRLGLSSFLGLGSTAGAPP